MSVILIFAVLTAYPTAPFASAHSHVSPTLEAQRHCERLLQASSGNSTTNPGAALDLDAVASVGSDQPADATDKDQSKGDAEPLKVTLKSFYLCHPTSSKVFLRCDVRAEGSDDGKTPFTRLSVVQGAVLSCEPGTFFNSVIKACVFKRHSNCAARSIGAEVAAEGSHEKRLCDEHFLSSPAVYSGSLSSRLICHDETRSDFVVCSLNSAFAHRFSCADGRFFNQRYGKCVQTMAESDCVAEEPEAGMMVEVNPAQRCVCQASRSASPSNVVYAADISDSHKFLVCLKDQIFINKCPKNLKWNEIERACDSEGYRKPHTHCEGKSGRRSHYSHGYGSQGATTNGRTGQQTSQGARQSSHGWQTWRQSGYNTQTKNGATTGSGYSTTQRASWGHPRNPWGQGSANSGSQRSGSWGSRRPVSGYGQGGSGQARTVVNRNPSSAGGSMENCICAAALRLTNEESAYRCDPVVQGGFLLCSRVAMGVRFSKQTCPNGLAWNEVKKACAPFRECSPVPRNCGDVSRTKGGIESRTEFGDNFSSIRKCVCADALLTTGESYLRRCDPLNPGGYLLCRTGVDPVALTCARGTKWNSVERSCASTGRCLPMPSRCSPSNNPLSPTTTPSCPLKYTLHKKKLDWHTARLVCEANDAELAVILNNATQTLLTERYGSDAKKSYGGIWIGASDGGMEGVWRWVTGPLVTNNFWYPGAPSGGKYQHCMQFNYYRVKGAWDDTRCYYKKTFLCQKPDCTSTINLPDV